MDFFHRKWLNFRIKKLYFKSKTVQISLPLPISAKTTEVASNMMKSILHFEPDRRPKLNQLIRDHPWFTKDIRDK